MLLHILYLKCEHRLDATKPNKIRELYFIIYHYLMHNIAVSSTGIGY